MIFDVRVRNCHLRSRTIALVATAAASASLLSSCSDTEESPQYGSLTDFCSDLDYAAAEALLPEEDSFVSGLQSAGELLQEDGSGFLECGEFSPWYSMGFYGGFAFHVNNLPVDEALRKVYIAGDQETWEDLENIYPFGKDEILDAHGPITADEIIPPEVDDLELDGWEKASYVRYSQGGDAADTWDPNKHGMILYFSLRDSNLTVDFALRLGDDGSGVDPETEPYLEMMTGIADQIADRLRQTES